MEGGVSLRFETLIVGNLAKINGMVWSCLFPDKTCHIANAIEIFVILWIDWSLKFKLVHI